MHIIYRTAEEVMQLAVPRELLYQILEYPLVTYITLIPRTLVTTDNISLPFIFENIELIMDAQTLTKKLRLLGINDPVTINFKDSIAILTTHLKVLDFKYRTIKITAIAERKVNMVQLLVVRKSYFYNTRLFINIYDLQGKTINIPTRVYQLT
jgi:uncharacterized membrane protein